MHALNDIPDVEVRCLNAGVDILLHPAKPDEVVNTLWQPFCRDGFTKIG